jgi:hypothetical protein
MTFDEMVLAATQEGRRVTSAHLGSRVYAQHLESIQRGHYDFPIITRSNFGPDYISMTVVYPDGGLERRIRAY